MQITFDVNPMVRRLDAIKAVQVPFAASLALNRVARDARKELREQMKAKFRNPVPFTLNSVYVKSSTKSNLAAEVGLKEFATKGNPASKYLLPQITGGPAYATRFQKALRANSILAPNEYAIPTQSDYLRLNQYGNIRPSQYTEILYSLQAFRDSSAFVYAKNAKKRRMKYGYTARTTRAYQNEDNPRLKKFFPGIYTTNPKAIENKESALFWITRTPQFQGKFPFTGIAGDYVRKNWDKEFGRALAEAIASAK